MQLDRVQIVAQYSPFLPSKTPGLLLGHFHLYYEAPLNQLCSFDRIWAESISLLYTSDFIITKHSNQSHWKHAHASHCSMFHRWCCMLRSSAVPSRLHTSFFPSFDCISFFQKCFLVKSKLVVTSLCLLWWSLLLIVDTSVSWREFFSWLDVVKERGSSDHHLCVCSGEVFSWL